MARSIIWYLHFVFSLVALVPTMYRYKALKNKLPPEEFAKKANAYATKWAAAQVKYSGARVTVKGLENIPEKGAVLFVSNHQSNFDIAFFLACIKKPKGYIAKSEMLKIPLIRTWMQYIQCVFMDRSSIKQSAKAIIQGVDILKSGYSLVVFPEGTRSKGKTVGEFKAGSFKLATKSKAPIVPVTIDGSYQIMELHNNKITPGDVIITVHPVVETAGLLPEELAALPEKVKATIVSSIQ